VRRGPRTNGVDFCGTAVHVISPLGFQGPYRGPGIFIKDSLFTIVISINSRVVEWLIF